MHTLTLGDVAGFRYYSLHWLQFRKTRNAMGAGNNVSANLVVALIEDDRALASAMSRYLAESGFEVKIGTSCAEAQLMAREDGIDLFILDRRLPDGDGLDLAKVIKAGSDAAVIILSGVGEVEARVEGLNTGADDYLAKPAAPEELLARVNAVIRRSRLNHDREEDKMQQFPSFCLDRINNLLVGSDQRRQQLTEIETMILTSLIRSSGKVVDKDALSLSALGRAWQPEDRSLDVHISRLRQKLRGIGVDENIIHTVRGQGYRFTPA